jgi:hypothetical protein
VVAELGLGDMLPLDVAVSELGGKAEEAVRGEAGT